MTNVTQSFEDEADYGLGTSFDPSEYSQTDILCPTCGEEYLRVIPFSNGPDDHENHLYCEECHYDEVE